MSISASNLVNTLSHPSGLDDKKSLETSLAQLLEFTQNNKGKEIPKNWSQTETQLSALVNQLDQICESPDINSQQLMLKVDDSNNCTTNAKVDKVLKACIATVKECIEDIKAIKKFLKKLIEFLKDLIAIFHGQMPLHLKPKASGQTEKK
ncbi:hypothetical protein SOPP22_08445 [Shewanella sp. OPT22]|nr:hypothetical protein SOPP22_08445 [Shewanella sp. OPT22]